MNNKERTFIPMNQRLIVQPIIDEVTKGGIILPGKKEDKPSMGIILHEGASGIFSTGDKVLFNQYTALKPEQFPDILIVKEEDIYLKIVE